MKTPRHGVLTKEELDVMYTTLLDHHLEQVGSEPQHQATARALVNLLFPRCLEVLRQPTDLGESDSFHSGFPHWGRVNDGVYRIVRALYEYRYRPSHEK